MIATLSRVPKKSTFKTAPVRVAADLAEMLALISTVDSTNSAVILDPLIRTHVRKLYTEALERQKKKGLEKIKPEAD